MLFTNENLTDEDCWRMFLAGDTQAFGQIVRNNYTALFNYGHKFTRNGQLVEDCIQELCLKLWKNRSTIGETFSVRNYLIKSLRRQLQQDLSKSSKNPSGDIDFIDLVESALQAEIPLFAEENRSELRHKVTTVLEHLSKRQQEIIYLRFYLGLGAGDIAVIMGLNRQTTYNLLQKAIASLRRMGDLLLHQGDSFLYLVGLVMTLL